MPSKVDGPGVAALTVGAVFTFAGLKGYSVLMAIQNVIQGKNPNEGQQTKGLTSSTGDSGSNPGPVGKGGNPAQNRALGKLLAASMFGWTGENWAALDYLWGTGESGWNNHAENASGAYGIAQALPETKYPLAGRKEGGSDPATQIRWGLRYIKARYQNPILALDAWKSRDPHWY